MISPPSDSSDEEQPENYTVLPSEVLQTLGKFWPGIKLRLPQEKIVSRILAGRDVLAILPTGAGKSLTFQLPAAHMGGLTLVVSPLLALMEDQVCTLQQRGLQAAFLRSGLGTRAEMQILEAAESGQLQFLYLSPERLVADFN